MTEVTLEVAHAHEWEEAVIMMMVSAAASALYLNAEKQRREENL